MGLQPHVRLVDTTAVPAFEAIHLGGVPSVKGPSMQRFAAVWHASPQKMVGVLFALLLAAMMAVGSGANFNSTSANPGNVVTAGNLSHVNGKDGLALLTVTKIKPAETQTGSVTIQNDGNIAGVFSVAGTIVSDSNALAGKPAFADKLRLTVTDTNTGQVVYNDGLLSAMGRAPRARSRPARPTRTTSRCASRTAAPTAPTTSTRRPPSRSTSTGRP